MAIQLFKVVNNLYNPVKEDAESIKNKEFIEKLDDQTQKDAQRLSNKYELNKLIFEDKAINWTDLKKRAKSIKNTAITLYLSAIVITPFAVASLIGAAFLGASLTFVPPQPKHFSSLGEYLGFGVSSGAISLVMYTSARLLNRSKIVLQNRALHSENFNQFTEKFFNTPRRAYTTGKLNKEVHVLYFEYKYSIAKAISRDRESKKLNRYHYI